MTDYASVLRRVILALEPNTAAARQEVYERARRALWDRLRGGEAPVPEAEAAREAEALESAIRGVERDMRQASAGAPAAGAGDGAIRRAAASPGRRRPVGMLPTAAGMVVLAALISGLLVYWTRSEPPAASRAANVNTAPGTAESADASAGVPYWFRRQPVFYRSIYPAGTVVIAKAQNFIYLVQGDTVALRYGMAIGPECADIAGMFEFARNGRAGERAGTQLAAVGQPAESPVLRFGNDRYSIEATNMRDSIGRPLPSGCIRMMHADAVDLLQRIGPESRVVVQ